MHSVELAPTPGEPPMLLLLMVVVAILVFRVGIQNSRFSQSGRAVSNAVLFYSSAPNHINIDL